MANFFQKILWVECLGEANPKCPKFVNKERLPAYRNKCTECTGRVRQITKPDLPKILALAALVVALAGGAYWYLNPDWVSAASRWIHRDSDTAGEPTPGKPTERNPSAAIHWSMETQQGGSSRSLSPDRDFNAKGVVYRTNDSFRDGDQLRLNVRSDLPTLYVFYRNGLTTAQQLNVDKNGQIPGDGNWLALDEHRGTGIEEFVLVASNNPLPELDKMTGTFDPVALDNEVRHLEGSRGKDPVLVRVQVKHE